MAINGNQITISDMSPKTLDKSNEEIHSNNVIFSEDIGKIMGEYKTENDDDLDSKERIINKYRKQFEQEIIYRNTDWMIQDEDIDKILTDSQKASEYTYSFDEDIDTVISNIEKLSEQIYRSDLESAFKGDYRNQLVGCLEDLFDEIVKEGHNLDSDFHVLSNMKILSYKETVCSDNVVFYIRDENAIIVDYDRIRSIAEEYNTEFNDILKSFLTYGVSLARKSTHPDDTENYLYYKSTTDTLIYEGTSGIETYVKGNINSDFSIKYFQSSEVRSMGELLLLGISNSDNDVLERYFNAVNDNDVSELWRILNLKDSEDIKHYYKILYSKDALLYRNPMIDIFYNSNSNMNFYDFVGNEYKLDLYIRSVTHLLDYQKENEISLEENLVLYNLILNRIMNDGIAGDTLNYDYFFCKKIEELNGLYIEYVAEYYGKSVDSIEEIIKTDVRYIMIDMCSIMHNDDKYIEEYMDKASEMLDRYPMTKAITASDYIYSTMYGKVMDLLSESESFL